MNINWDPLFAKGKYRRIANLLSSLPSPVLASREVLKPNGAGFNMLHQAIRWDAPRRFVRLLLSHSGKGALREVTDRGLTVIHLAAEFSSRPDVVELLLDADPFLCLERARGRACEGCTPIELVDLNLHENSGRIRELLVAGTGFARGEREKGVRRGIMEVLRGRIFKVRPDSTVVRGVFRNVISFVVVSGKQ